jgi:integrase
MENRSQDQRGDRDPAHRVENLQPGDLRDQTSRQGGRRPDGVRPEGADQPDQARFRCQGYLFERRTYGKGKRENHRYTRQHVSNLVHQCALKTLGRCFGAHTLRNSFANHAPENGINIYALGDYLGHKNIETTIKYYLHNKVDPGKLLDAMKLN